MSMNQWIFLPQHLPASKLKPFDAIPGASGKSSALLTGLPWQLGEPPFCLWSSRTSIKLFRPEAQRLHGFSSLSTCASLCSHRFSGSAVLQFGR